MATIVPAILEETKEGFLGKVARVTKLPGVERIQVDFGDGKFVPHTTLSVHDIDPLNPAYTWEAHLMVEEPVDFLDYQIAGFKMVIVHLESFASEPVLREGIVQVKKLGLKVGLALNPETSVEAVQAYADLVDQFTLLSVTPGKQGQPMGAGAPERLAALRKLLPNAILEVDGGVKPSNIAQVKAAGANLIAVGSALFETENVQENYDTLAQALI